MDGIILLFILSLTKSINPWSSRETESFAGEVDDDRRLRLGLTLLVLCLLVDHRRDIAGSAGARALALRCGGFAPLRLLLGLPPLDVPHPGADGLAVIGWRIHVRSSHARLNDMLGGSRRRFRLRSLYIYH